MESTTEMLFSQANINAESAQKSSNETQNEKNKVKDIPRTMQNEEEKEELNSESKNESLKEGMASKESGIHLIPFNSNEAKEINYEKELEEFIFPIINSQKLEESKNSEVDNFSSSNKAVRSSGSANFSLLNLKIPETIKLKNKFSMQPILLNQNSTQNYYQNFGLSNIQNIFPSPSLPLQNFFGFVLKNGYVSSFVPITFSCSIDIPRDRRARFRSKQKEQEFFEKIIKIADVKDISEFWAVFQHLKKPSECPVGTDYHVFKQGIVPMWEDSNNKNGGKLSVLLTWKYANVIWEEVVFNFAKGYLPFYDYINGIVISNRPKFLVLSFWVKTNTSSVVEKIRNSLSELIQTPSANCIDFIPFN